MCTCVYLCMYVSVCACVYLCMCVCVYLYARYTHRVVSEQNANIFIERLLPVHKHSSTEFVVPFVCVRVCACV